MSVIYIKTKEDYIKFKRAPKAILLYGAQWCQVCKDVIGFYERLAKRYSGKLAFGYVDVEQAKLDFSEVPVFVTLREGKQISSLLGADHDDIKQKIRELLRGR